jgi:hypothetical protein
LKEIFDPHDLFFTYGWMLHMHIFYNSDPIENCALLGYYLASSDNFFTDVAEQPVIFKGQVFDP